MLQGLVSLFYYINPNAMQVWNYVRLLLCVRGFSRHVKAVNNTEEKTSDLRKEKILIMLSSTMNLLF